MESAPVKKRTKDTKIILRPLFVFQGLYYAGLTLWQFLVRLKKNMTFQTTKIENGTIALPRIIRQNWDKADILIFPSQDTLLIKKIEKSINNLSEIAQRISSKPAVKKIIAKEIKLYRKNK